MTPYRIYVLNPEDQVACEREARFASDREALERAEDARAGEYAAEVWQGERLVARLGGEFRIDMEPTPERARPRLRLATSRY